MHRLVPAEAPLRRNETFMHVDTDCVSLDFMCYACLLIDRVNHVLSDASRHFMSAEPSLRQVKV